MRTNHPVELRYAFAALGIAGAAYRSSAAVADDSQLRATCAFGWVIPVVAATLLAARRDPSDNAGSSAWARAPHLAFVAGAVGGSAFRLVTGIEINGGLALVYGLGAAAGIGYILFKLHLLKAVLGLLQQLPFVTPLLLLAAGILIGGSNHWTIVAGFGLVLLAGERVGRARLSSIVDLADRRAPLLATAAALSIATLLEPGAALHPSGPPLIAAAAAVMAAFVGLHDYGAFWRLGKLAKTSTRAALPPGAELGWPRVNFGQGDQEWRFDGAGGVTTFGWGDPERAQRAVELHLLADLGGVLLTAATLAVVLRRSGW